MANTFFQFKQFRIEQAVGGMKVSTDACIQGAWVYRAISKLSNLKVLDIGAGTGLLSLMLAQSDAVASVTAIEIEPSAAAQCKSNFEQSPWKEKFTLFAGDVQYFLETAHEKFDVIIANPPFFENHLKATDTDRNTAFHDDSMPKSLLAKAIAQCLTESGAAYILYPSTEWSLWEKQLEHHSLYVKQAVQVYPSPKKTHNRIIGEVVKVSTETTIQPFSIRANGNDYSEEFIALLAPFYLNL